jgi:hypothetical protein
MINNPEQTTQEEILLISQTFGIPIDKIQAVLLKNDNPPKKTKDPKKAIPKKIDNSESLTPQMEILNFNDFDDFYINAKNREEEITVIRKFIPACILPIQAKTLFQACADNQTLKEEIILRWVIISKNLPDLLEVKSLTTKGTPAGDLAYRKYIQFF